MMKLLKKALYSALLLLILTVCLLSFFLTTTPGLYSTIRVIKLYVPGSLKVHHLTGRFLDKFSIGELDYQYNTTKIKIKDVTVNWNLKSLLSHQIVIKKLKVNALEMTKNNNMQRIKNLNLAGVLNQHSLRLDKIRFNYLDQQFDAKLHVDRQPPHILSGTIQLKPADTNPKELAGTVDIGGDLNQIQWTGELHGPGTISINGSLNKTTELNQVIKWRDLQWPINKHQTLYSPEGRINLTGVLPVLNMTLNTKINTSPQNYWQMNTNIQGEFPMKWTLDTNVSKPYSPSSTSEGLYTILTAKGEIKDANHGNIALTVQPGQYQLPEDSMISSLEFKGGVINLALSPKNLTGSGSIALDENKKIKLLFHLPKFNITKGLSSNQSFSGELGLELNSLDFLQNISPDLSNPRGHLTASVTAEGTLAKAVIESKLILSKASVSFPQLGLNLDAIDLTVLGKKQFWEATGSLASAGKTLILKGQGPLNSKFSGDFLLQGSDFPIVNTKEYQINITPQLKLNLSSSLLNISGSILVPYAQIKPQSFTNSLSLSEDVVYKTNEKEQPSLFNTSMDVRVDMGNQVELTFKGLHAILDGNVQVKKVAQGSINANGELSVKKGEYKAYGQDLAIEQGQLIYTGGRLDSPGINLRASKTIENSTATFSGSNQLFDFNTSNLQNVNLGSTIKVGVEVTGRLTAPKIQLFSNPSILSQADILSMLLLGRPASQANKAGGQLLLAAISSMNLGTGTNGAQLLEQLKQNLGLDFNVQTNTNYNQKTNQVTDTTALVVSKSLSKRLYLSYNVGLSQSDPNVLTLKYLLNKFFSIQVSSSTGGNGIDLLYTRSKDKIDE